MRLLYMSAVSAVFVTASFAVEQINWFSTGATGTINYTTLGGSAIGSNINIANLQGLNVPTNPNIFVNCFSCKLNFQTGNATSDTSGTSWTFSDTGSSISVTGGFDLNHNGVLDATDIQPGALLLSGVFNTPITVTTPNLTKPDLLFTAGTILNIVNSQLSNFYGVPGGLTWNGTYGQTIDSTRPQFPGAGAGHYQIQTVALRSGLINDQLVVPEPTDVVLFSSVAGILVAGIALRRRRMARQNA